MPPLSADDLPSYRRAIDRSVRAWGQLADHVRARLTAALRRAHGTNLHDGFEGGPDIPRSFQEACLGFRQALKDLHAFEDRPPAFPSPQWGNRSLALEGPLPVIDQWIASLDGMNENEWRSRVVDPFRQQLGVASLYFEDFIKRLDRAKEAVIASSANQPATRLRIEKAIRQVLTEEHERGEADKADGRLRLHQLFTAALNGMTMLNESVDTWADRVTARLVSIGREIVAQGWEDWIRENAKGESIIAGLIDLMLQSDEAGIDAVVRELQDSPHELRHLADRLRSLQHDWSFVFDRGWLWWKLTGDLPLPQPQPTHLMTAQQQEEQTPESPRQVVEDFQKVKTAGYRPSTELSRIVFELNNPASGLPANPGDPGEVPNPFDEARRPWLPILREHIGKVPELVGCLTEEKLRQWLWREFKVPPTQDLNAEQLVAVFEDEQTGQPSEGLTRIPANPKPTVNSGSDSISKARAQVRSGIRRGATMPAKTFRWLHLTDLHFGLAGQKSLWPNIRDVFFADLQSIAETTGPWDAVFFTGDFTQRGAREEFLAMEEQVLGPLWDTFRRLGSNPVLLAVPGNHDLIRPDEAEPSVRQMTIGDRFQEVATLFWLDPACPYRMAVARAFENYETWWSRTPLSEALDIHRGILPGDFSTTLTTAKGLRIGVVGLNTTFLQLVSGNFETRLACDALQLNEVCGGDPPGWCADKDTCILLTHQPPNWFFPTIQERAYAEINPAGRFVLHLFGHMHENVIRTTSVGGGKPLRQWQGCSLFGLECFNDTQERRHGYSAGTLNFSRKRASIGHWPRKAVFDKSSGWRFARDSESCSLRESDGGTKPESFELLQTGAKCADQLEMRIQRHIQAMDVPDADDRRRAIRVLGDIGHAAKRALPHLMRGFKDPNEEVRGAAGEAVLKMGTLAIPFLRKALNDLDPSVRGRSAGLLGEFAPSSPDVIPELIRLLDDSHTGVRRTAASSLEKFGSLANDAAPSLCRLLGDSDRDMRRHAAQALGKINTVPDEAVTALASALPGELDEEARRGFVYALGDIGSPLALDALAHALHDPQRHVAALAAEAIGKTGVANDACLSSLIDALGKSDYPLLSFNIIRTLGIVKSCQPDVIAALQRVAGNVNSTDASCAAWALGEIGPAATSAIPELRRLMSQSPDEMIRRMAAEAIKKINPEAEQ